jgi:hypothetical protein
MAKQDDGSARRFFDKLDTFAGSKYAFTCMIKPSDNDQYIMVARAGDCSKWAQLPARQVEDIEFVRSVHCGGHTHPLVHVFMKAPTSADAEAFASLATLYHEHPAQQGHPIQPHLNHLTAPMLTSAFPALATQTAMTASHIPTGATPCYWDWGLRRWVC